jgi:SAM-dependent methyltransferase
MFIPLTSEQWGEEYSIEKQAGDTIRQLRTMSYKSWTQEFIKIVKPGSKTLEIGCGSGVSSLALSQNGSDVTLLDYSRSALALAKYCAETLGIKARFVLADATRPLPFDDKFFDYIIHAGLLEHFSREKRIELLGFWKRHTQYMISMVPNASSLAYRIGKESLEKSGKWKFGFEEPVHTQRDEFFRAGLRTLSEYSIGLSDALWFLDECPEFKTELTGIYEHLARKKDDIFFQGYLLVTIGESE